MKCSKCGTEVPITEVLTTMPPQYKGTCPKCGNTVIDNSSFQEVTGATIKFETKPAIKEYQQKFIQLFEQAEKDLGCKITNVDLSASDIYFYENQESYYPINALQSVRRKIKCRIIVEDEK